MLKLKLRFFGYLMQRVYSLEKTLDAGRDWGQEEKGTTEDEMGSAVQNSPEEGPWENGGGPEVSRLCNS